MSAAELDVHNLGTPPPFDFTVPFYTPPFDYAPLGTGLPNPYLPPLYNYNPPSRIGVDTDTYPPPPFFFLAPLQTLPPRTSCGTWICSFVDFRAGGW